MKQFILILLIGFSYFTNYAQFTAVAIRSNSFLHFKAKTESIQTTELFGSSLEVNNTISHEIFLSTSYRIGKSVSIRAGIGIGYFNIAYNSSTTRDFLDSEFSDLESIRISSEASSYYGVYIGVEKSLYKSEIKIINLNLGIRPFFTEPVVGEFGRFVNSSNNNKEFIVFARENINSQNNLDFNIDVNLNYSKKIKNSPVWWDIGIYGSLGLTNLWDGIAELQGDSGKLILKHSDKLTFVGLQLGFSFFIY